MSATSPISSRLQFETEWLESPECTTPTAEDVGPGARESFRRMPSSTHELRKALLLIVAAAWGRVDCVTVMRMSNEFQLVQSLRIAKRLQRNVTRVTIRHCQACASGAMLPRRSLSLSRLAGLGVDAYSVGAKESQTIRRSRRSPSSPAPDRERERQVTKSADRRAIVKPENPRSCDDSGGQIVPRSETEEHCQRGFFQWKISELTSRADGETQPVQPGESSGTYHAWSDAIDNAERAVDW